MKKPTKRRVFTHAHAALVVTETEALRDLTRAVDAVTRDLADALDDSPAATDAQIAAGIARYSEILEEDAAQSIEAHRAKGHDAMWAALLLMLGGGALTGRAKPPVSATSAVSSRLAAKSLSSAWAGQVLSAFHRWRKTAADTEKLAAMVRGVAKAVASKVGAIATTEVASAVNDTAHAAASIEALPAAAPPVNGGPYRTPGAISPAEVLPIEPPPPHEPPVSEVVEKGRVRWYWDAILDARVCPVCAAKDGETLVPGVGLWPPAHPRCRCVATPQEL